MFAQEKAKVKTGKSYVDQKSTRESPKTIDYTFTQMTTHYNPIEKPRWSRHEK